MASRLSIDPTRRAHHATPFRFGVLTEGTPSRGEWLALARGAEALDSFAIRLRRSLLRARYRSRWTASPQPNRLIAARPVAAGAL
jgi:hypothetical protein